MSAEFLSTHDAYECRYPDEADIAVAYEAHNRAQHERTHGSLDGYQPGREFPCPGLIRVVDDSGPIWTVRCSACDFETTMRSLDRPPAAASAGGEQW